MRKDKTNNKLNTPYRTNIEYAKRNAKYVNEHNFEFGQEENYKFSTPPSNSDKDSALARGANIANAFSYPLAASSEEASNVGNFGKYNEEYALGNNDNVSLEREVSPEKLKRKYQENLRQNFNVEFSDDELICDNCENCKNNCARRNK